MSPENLLKQEHTTIIHQQATVIEQLTARVEMLKKRTLKKYAPFSCTLITRSLGDAS